MTAAMLMLLALPTFAMALELDPAGPGESVQGMVVRVNNDGSREMFKASLTDAGKSNAQVAGQETLGSLTSENQVPFVKELDRTSSQESWCWGPVYPVYTPVYYYGPWVTVPTVYYPAPYYPQGYLCGPATTCYYYETVRR